MALVLTCPAGLEELARGDLQQAAVVARPSAPGQLQVEDLPDVQVLQRHPMIDRVAVSGVDRESLTVAETVCRAAGFAGTIAFRVGAAAAAARADVIRRITDETGWRNDPSAWQLNVDLDHDRVEVGPLAWAARFGTLDRLPASTPPTVCAGLLRLAKLRDGDRLLDPCGGVASIPIIDAAVRPDGLGLSIDADAEAVAVAQANVGRRELAERVEVEQGDATRLDLPDSIADRVVSDLPFGRRVGSNDANKQLYPAVLGEIARVLTVDGRAVLLTDDKRTFEDAARRSRDLKVVKQTVIGYNGVTPTAYVLTRVRTRARR